VACPFGGAVRRGQPVAVLVLSVIAIGVGLPSQSGSLHQHGGTAQPLSRDQLKQCAACASSKRRRDGLDLSELTKPLASGHRHACERDTGQRATPARPR
jgi:hypothetical protein